MKLVKGYLTAEVSSGQSAGLVRHVAQFDDGRLAITTYPHPEDSHYFSRPNWAWHWIEEAPEGLRYIGQYEQTMVPTTPPAMSFADWLNIVDARHGYDCRRYWGSVEDWRTHYENGLTVEAAANLQAFANLPRAL